MSRPILIAAHLVLYGALFAASGILGNPDAAFLSLILATGLIACSITAIERFIIPDTASLGLILAGLGATWHLNPDQLGWHALSAGIVFLALSVL